jgi:hypothetical protein
MSLQPMEDYFHDRVRIETRTRNQMQARVTFPTDLQGPPEAGHGGGVAAMLFELVRLFRDERGGATPMPRPVRIDVAIHRAVPLDTPLAAEVETAEGCWNSRILREDRLVAGAVVSPMLEPLVPVGPEIRRRWEDSNRQAHEVPGYEFCLACGLRNARGAQVRFDYNDALVWKRLQPQAHFRCADGSLFPGYLSIVADEIGWWMGALRQGECGLSTRVTVCLGRPVAYGVSLLIVGDRSAVTASDTKGRIWQTRAAIVTSDWTPVGTADVQFAGSRAFTRVMLPQFLPGGNPAALRRLFPRYAAPPEASECTGE